MESSLGAYSDYCGSYIKSPVGRKVFTIERTYDEYGMLISESVDGPPRVIQIESQYADMFDRYFNSWKGWATMWLINSIAKSHHRETNPFLASSLAIGFFTNNINQLEGILKKKCTDDRILTAYKNMYNYAYQRPAISDKYSTLKEPPVKDKKNGTSAPEATKVIQAKRQERIEQQNQRANAEAQKRMEDFKARKAQGIAVHSGSKGRSVPANGSQDQAAQIQQYQENQKKLQELGLAHQKQMLAATEQFSQDMQNATTPEERRAIQQQYQKDQQQKTLELQEAIMKLKSQ